MKWSLPVTYNKLRWNERKEVRDQYRVEQGNKCLYCKNDLNGNPSKEIIEKYIDWDLFPPNFLKHPVHLHHDHDTGMTEGTVHALCNAIMWQYTGK